MNQRGRGLNWTDEDIADIRKSLVLALDHLPQRAIRVAEPVSDHSEYASGLMSKHGMELETAICEPAAATVSLQAKHQTKALERHGQVKEKHCNSDLPPS